jgi:hypothetical protein
MKNLCIINIWGQWNWVLSVAIVFPLSTLYTQLREETKLFQVVNILNYILKAPGLDLYSDEVYSDWGFLGLQQS